MKCPKFWEIGIAKNLFTLADKYYSKDARAKEEWRNNNTNIYKQPFILVVDPFLVAYNFMKAITHYLTHVACGRRNKCLKRMQKQTLTLSQLALI